VLLRLDLALLRLLRTRLHQPALEQSAKAASWAGEHGLGWQLACAVGAAADPARRPRYLRAMRAAAAAYAANQLIKLCVRRERPDVPGLPPLVQTHSQLSYPSAHAATSFAAACVLGPAPIQGLATLVALTRPYLGVHWPSDTLAGAALGSAVARLVP
jgi:membrane-associated phospholipid phosphatase